MTTDMESSQKFDVVIVGAGPAAWAAATYLGRADVKTLVVGNPEQSGLFDAAPILNYPGFPKGILGKELLDRMMTQSLEHGVTFLKSDVTHLEQMKPEFQPASGRFYVRLADRQEFYADNLILAHGANYIKVNLPGEEQFAGKGVHYCALCDGPLYRDKDILVLGNGNYAADEAIQLQTLAHRIRIVSHGADINMTPPYLAKLAEKKIEIIMARVSEIASVDDVVTGIKVEATGPKSEGDAYKTAFNADAVFVALGVASSYAFAKKLGLEMNGSFLKTDEYMRTNVSGVWAAGLSRGGVNQISKSVGDGAVAAVDIIKVVKGIPQYIDHS